MPEGFTCSIPEIIEKKINVTEVYANHTQTGKFSSYGIDIKFPELHLFKTIKSSEMHALRGKIENTLKTWGEKYERHLDKLHIEKQTDHVDQLNQEAKEALESLNNILNHTLTINDTVDWDAIKRKDAFRIKPNKLFDDNQKPGFISFNSYGKPIDFEKNKIPIEPDFKNIKNEFGLITKVFRGKFIQKEFDERVEKWKKEKERIIKENSNRELLFKKIIVNFEIKKEMFED